MCTYTYILYTSPSRYYLCHTVVKYDLIGNLNQENFFPNIKHVISFNNLIYMHTMQDSHRIDYIHGVNFKYEERLISLIQTDKFTDIYTYKGLCESVAMFVVHE